MMTDSSPDSMPLEWRLAVCSLEKNFATASGGPSGVWPQSQHWLTGRAFMTWCNWQLFLFFLQCLQILAANKSAIHVFSDAPKWHWHIVSSVSRDNCIHFFVNESSFVGFHCLLDLHLGSHEWPLWLDHCVISMESSCTLNLLSFLKFQIALKKLGSPLEMDAVMELLVCPHSDIAAEWNTHVSFWNFHTGATLCQLWRDSATHMTFHH